MTLHAIFFAFYCDTAHNKRIPHLVADGQQSNVERNLLNVGCVKKSLLRSKFEVRTAFSLVLICDQIARCQQEHQLAAYDINAKKHIGFTRDFV